MQLSLLSSPLRCTNVIPLYYEFELGFSVDIVDKNKPPRFVDKIPSAHSFPPGGNQTQDFLAVEPDCASVPLSTTIFNWRKLNEN